MTLAGSWQRGVQEPNLRGVTASERRGGTFSYFLPARIAGQDPGGLLDRDLREEALEISAQITASTAAVDEATRRGIFPLLLRSESIASSRIERIAASPRDVAYAQLGPGDAHLRNHDAGMVARNVEATRLAIAQLSENADWSLGDIEDVHRALDVVGVRAGLREVDVWIGGRDRLRAQYVAPPADVLPDLITDLLAYINTSGEHPFLLAAICHLQFGAIHPFEDGNGRVGRALIHALLERGGVVRSGLLPISTVIRRREREYVAALSAFRTDDASEATAALEGWVRFFISAAQDATDEILRVQSEVGELDRVLEAKASGLRADSSARRILPLLREQPVITASFIADSLDVSAVAAHSAVKTLVERGILTPGTGRYRRSAVFQAPDVLGVLDGS